MADVFLHLEGVNGGSTDRDHEDWIEIHTVSWGVETPTGAGGGRGGATVAGRLRQTPFVLTAPTSIATPRILDAIARGLHIRRAMIDARRPGQERSQSIARWALQEITLTGLDIDGGANGFVDSFVLSPRRVELTTYLWADGSGAPESVTTEWDFTDHGVRVTPPGG